MMDDQEVQRILRAWQVGRETKALLERVLDAAFPKLQPVNRHERRKAAALARRAAR